MLVNTNGKETITKEDVEEIDSLFYDAKVVFPYPPPQPLASTPLTLTLYPNPQPSALSP